MGKETYALCEAVADLALAFSEKEKRPDDSREMIRLAIEWAEIFEARTRDREWEGDYLEAIDAFFADQYAAWLAGSI